MRSPTEREEALRAARRAARDCARCPQLAQSRTQVVHGAGNPDADLVVVVDAPGREEDRTGVPLGGRPYGLLAELLAAAGIAPADIYVTGVLLCRPPDNRDPTPAELDRCRDHLLTQLELVRPLVVCTAGTIATRALRGRPEAITRVRGRDEVVSVSGRRLRLLPVLHPAAALYQRAGVEQLRDDLARLPALLALPRLEDPPGAAPPPTPAAVPSPDDGQLELF